MLTKEVIRQPRPWLRLLVLPVLLIVLAILYGIFIIPEEQTIDVSHPPQFIQADFIDLDRIYSISKFRSGSGHDFSAGSGETCRSMKHYFNVQISREAEQLRQQNNGMPPPPNGKDDIPIFSPVDGKIVAVVAEQMPIGKQIYIQPDQYPSIRIRLFHIYELKTIKKDTAVSSGEQIGVIGQYQNTDIAITQGNNYLSYFQVIPDSIFSKYQKRGAKNREEFILSREYRDANPLECNGERFAVNYDSDPNRGDFVYLSGYGATR